MLAGSSDIAGKTPDERKFGRELDAVAIVAAGCVFPGAASVPEFWELCRRGESRCCVLSEERKRTALHLSEDSSNPDGISSVLAAEISQREIQRLRAKYPSLNDTNRLELLVHEALTQVFSDWSPDPALRRVTLLLGLMSPDEEYCRAFSGPLRKELGAFLRGHWSGTPGLLGQFEEAEAQDAMVPDSGHAELSPAAMMNRLRARFNLSPLSCIIDAACASSLASFDQGISLLRAGIADAVAVGGADSNLSAGHYAIFSRVGALAKERSIPFDERSEGLVQGEGVGILVLRRLSDAVADGDKVLAIVSGCDGSSDGRTTSLFQPNPEGQILALEKVYGAVGSRQVDYLEGHGTGTRVGDRAELDAATRFFSGSSFPMASVKYQIGHTKGAAGAASVIKVLGLIRDQEVPPIPGVSHPLSANEGPVLRSRESIPIGLSGPARIGVSSFGFGGCNFHLAMEAPDSATSSWLFPERASPFARNFFIIGKGRAGFGEVLPELFSGKDAAYRVPPQSFSRIDKTQLAAVLAADRAFRSAGLSAAFLPSESVAVFSASQTGLEIWEALAGRLRVTETMELLRRNPRFPDSPERRRLLALMADFRARLPEPSEDSAPGILNNVIAGRVCNAFDLHGKSLNLDAGFASPELARTFAMMELGLERAQVVVLLLAEEEACEEGAGFRRQGVSCELLTTAEFCSRNFLEAQEQLTMDWRKDLL